MGVSDWGNPIVRVSAKVHAVYTDESESPAGESGGRVSVNSVYASMALTSDEIDQCRQLPARGPTASYRCRARVFA